MKIVFGISALILLSTLSLVGQPARTALDRAWSFALDPVAIGEDEGWYDNQKTDLKTLRPGEHQSLTIRVTESAPEITIVKPGDFVILRKTFNKLL